MTNLLDHTAPDALLLTDGGLETVLVFHDGFDLPAFAAFPLLDTAEGRAALLRYQREFLAVAASAGTGFVLETPTWRASPTGAPSSGTTAMRCVGSPSSRGDAPRACVGWTGAGADAGERLRRAARRRLRAGPTMTVDEAAAYHAPQVRDLVDAGVDLVTSFTFSYADEASGFAVAAAEAGVPVVVGVHGRDRRPAAVGRDARRR